MKNPKIRITKQTLQELLKLLEDKGIKQAYIIFGAKLSPRIVKNIFDGILFLLDQGIENVYVTGELKKGKIRNHLYSKGDIVNIDEVPKVKTIIHGSGCALSTSILCFLVNKESLRDACSKSQNLMKVLVKKSRNHIHQNILKI